MTAVFRPPIVAVLDEHCEELGFLRVQRRALPFSPDAKLRHLASVEQRARAHKDALRLPPHTATLRAEVRLMRLERSSREPFQWSAALEVLMEHATDAPAALWAKLVALDDDLVDAFSEALRRVTPGALARLFAHTGGVADEPRVLAARADAVAYRQGFQPAERVPGDELPAVRRARARGLSLAATADRAALARALDALVDDADVSVRRAALWSLALCDQARAAAVARARLDDPFSLRVLGLVGELSDLEAVAHALGPDATRRAAFDALGDLGHADAATLLAKLAARAEPWSDAAARALAKLAGPVPVEARGCLGDTLRAQVALLGPLPRDARVLRGRVFDQVDGDSALESLWTAAVTIPEAASQPVLAPFRREVPSGFFSGETRDDAHPADGPWSS